ncbi:MAG: hypothetical protein A2Z45_10540 [Chloroflexi bacterium RBG_19FT_COMBO_55_16]|nr:MAG: hypothetical protein A2Z45_10540 [Chloroflexi bacterium RBG_19FT_COMBO_55_16]
MILFWKAEALGALAFVHLAKGELSEVEAIIQRIDNSGQKPAAYFYTTHVALAECEFWLKKQNNERLFQVTDLFFQKLDQGDNSIFIPYAHYYRAEALRQMGMQEQAGEAFDLAVHISRNTSQRQVLWKTLAAQASFQLGLGNQEAARESAREAWGVIQYIAEHTGAVDLRHSFLNLLVVKEVAGLVLRADQRPLNPETGTMHPD